MYVGVDVGGTFTDIAINLGDGSDLILYKLSSTPEAPEVAIVEGIKTIMKNHNLHILIYYILNMHLSFSFDYLYLILHRLSM